MKNRDVEMQKFSVSKTDISFTIFPLNVSEFCLPFPFFLLRTFSQCRQKIFSRDKL